MTLSFRANFHYLRLFLVGLVMGIANIIPGVSGGTIAVVFGIYEELMEALGNIISDTKKRKFYFKFLSILFSGVFISILVFSKLLAWAFDNYELVTIYFFMGLILGSIPVVVKAHEDMRINASRLASLFLGLALVVILSLFQEMKGTNSTTFDHTQYGLFDYLYFLICGIISASAMIIPGISGSFLLVLLGVYRTVLDSINDLSDIIIHPDFSPAIKVRIFLMISLGLGIIVGIFGFARVINWALKHFPSITMYFILGLLIGSIYQIYPGYEINWNGLASIVSFSIGLIISLRFGVEQKTSP